jgi:hypothetical protein
VKEKRTTQSKAPSAPTPIGGAVASTFALAGFTTALITGIIAGNSGTYVLATALCAMFACYLLGSITGLAVDHVVYEYTAEHVKKHPIPKLSTNDEILVVDEAPEEVSPAPTSQNS